jgi:hypothetical protein
MLLIFNKYFRGSHDWLCIGRLGLFLLWWIRHLLGFFLTYNYQIESIITIAFFELSYFPHLFHAYLYHVFSSYFETKYHLDIFLLMPTTMHGISTVCAMTDFAFFISLQRCSHNDRFCILYAFISLQRCSQSKCTLRIFFKIRAALHTTGAHLITLQYGSRIASYRLHTRVW